MSRLSVPLKGRASGPSGHFAQPRLIGYSGPPTGRPALHHRESARSLPLPHLPFPPPPHPHPSLLLLLLHRRCRRRPRRLLTHPVPPLCPSSSACLALVSRFVEPLASCHPIDDDSTLSLAEARESSEPAEKERQKRREKDSPDVARSQRDSRGDVSSGWKYTRDSDGC